MRSRALNLAALAILTGLCGSIGGNVRPAAAQQLDAGKPPAQIFAGTCAACHRSPRGLVRSVAPGSLPSFLRQHYTTGNDMAGTMASYVLGNGGTQAVAEPPAKQEPKQRAKSDGTELAARTPAADPKAQSKAARQAKAGKKGQEPVAAPPAPEAEKPAESAKPVEPVKPETPAAEPPKSEAAATECKVEAAKPDDESKPPRQPAALLTLPGFPAPVAEPEPEAEPAAHGGCEPAASATATAAARTDEQHGERGKDAATEQPKEQPMEQAPATPPPALAEAPKAEPLRTTVTEAPTLDIMREEVHAPRLVRPSQKKRAAPAQ